MQISLSHALGLLALLAAAGPTLAIEPLDAAPGVRVQLEQVIFEILPDGSSRPIDHQVVDVFPLTFDSQYGAVDRSSEVGAYGASYIEVPSDVGGDRNHNIYLYMKDGSFGVVADGYHNGGVPGAMFKLTASTIARDGDHVRVRVMHVINPPPPPPGGGKPAAGIVVREIQKKVDAFLRAR